jgi:hypothetical protein
MYVFDLNVIRRTENIYAVSLHFYKRRTRWPISYSLNEIYSSYRLSSLSAQIQLESNSYGWQSFPIGDVIQRQINYLTLSQKSEYFGITFKPIVTTKTQRRNIIELEKFSVYTPFLIIYSNDLKQTNIFEEFIPKNFEQDIKSYEQYENEVNQRNRFFIIIYTLNYITTSSFFIDFDVLLKKNNQQLIQIYFYRIGMIQFYHRIRMYVQ